MKTYQGMLEGSQSHGERLLINRKPVFRSSAIFPFVLGETTNTFIHFMGYWLFKRQIKEISILFTIRDQSGGIVKRDTLLIDKVKAFIIDVRRELIGANQRLAKGSIELEVYSARDMVFPYPAFILEYCSAHGSSFVHTASRVYNDLEDLVENQSFEVPESGFDVYPNSIGFVGFVNGPNAANEVELNIEAVNCEGRKAHSVMRFKKLQAYQTELIYLNDLDEEFFCGKSIFARITHSIKGVFPRFIAGNMEPGGKFITLTHTYYDISKLKGQEHYWTNPNPQEFRDASIHIPVLGGDQFVTNLAIYPIYAQQRFSYSIQYFRRDGSKIDFPVLDGTFDSYEELPLYLNLSSSSDEEIVSARIDFHGNGVLPSRLKFGLNVSCRDSKPAMSSNICFNAEPVNQKLITKPGTTKWMLIPNRCRSLVTIHNGSWVKSYERKARVVLKFWRQSDESTISRSQIIKPDGFFCIDTLGDEELNTFFEGKPGWVTVESDSPFVNAWYFEVSGWGMIGADHSF